MSEISSGTDVPTTTVHRPARKRTPRVLVVVHSAKPAGAQLVALHQAEALAADHELVIAIGHGPLRARFERLGELIRAPTRVPVWGASRARWALELARAIPDAIRLAIVAQQRRIDVIVANSTVLIAPVLAGRLARVPVLVCAHEAPKSRAARLVFRFHGALANTVIAISPWIAENFSRARSHVVISAPGIPVPTWNDRLVPDSTLPLRLLVVGTIDSHKRQDLAVSALASIRDAGVDAKLEILGRATDHASTSCLHELVDDLELRDRVDFVGESSDVLGRMRSSDAVLVPAGEVTPLVLMEAMAVGTPVVAARMGSIPDVVVDGESGLLVEPGNADAIADAVCRLRDEPVLRRRLVTGGREQIERHFDQSRSNDTLRAEVRRLAALDG